MDAISALDTAACILSITEFVTDLLSISHVSKLQPLQGARDERVIPDTLRNLRAALSENQIPSVPHQPPHNALNPSSNASAPALGELTSLRAAASALLEEIEGVLRQSPNERGLQVNDAETRALLRSRLAGTPYIEKLEQLPRAVTNLVDSILM